MPGSVNLDLILRTTRHPVIDTETGLMTKVWQRQFQNLNVAVKTLQSEGAIFVGAHALRVVQDPNNYATGSIWYETDRTVAYIANVVPGKWTYAWGTMQGMVASSPTDLGVNDTGFYFQCTDCRHIVTWTGTAWVFADSGSGYFADFAVAPDVNGWALCDGSVTDYLMVGAVLSMPAFTTPNLTSGDGGQGVYRKGGAAYANPVVTTNGHATGGGAVDPAHIITLPYFRR